ncbi:CvfB family protein [Haliovirga abyssi]|uniref:RNA-binding protein n=1 Tax=Haliovirga abyssi TaxID=2996794 RepID=A0AAU9D660_9FUSO|nr:S1-like domain-containing RNA-binding protein [Haliovirga abyssi]BDU51536.1 RNA-binding protein [Haliovirga abyssi]
MVKIGKIQKMKVNNIEKMGAYLDSGTGYREDNILLPKSQLTKDVKEGDEIEVFIYRDSEDRLIATTKKPYGQVEELAYLKAVDETTIGAFMDIGLERDLFLPFREQKYTIEIGKKYLVNIYLDKSERLCASTNIYQYLKDNSPYVQDDRVIGIVYDIKPGVGIFVAVDKIYRGLIPEKENFKKLKCGEEIETRVIRVREDGKLDLSMREKSYIQMDTDSEMIFNELKKNRGFLELNDKSSPEDIKRKLNMSKKSFKRAVGRLLKENKIIFSNGGIKLVK